MALEEPLREFPSGTQARAKRSLVTMSRIPRPILRRAIADAAEPLHAPAAADGESRRKRAGPSRQTRLLRSLCADLLPDSIPNLLARRLPKWAFDQQLPDAAELANRWSALKA
eukprot:6980228-Pyramimonas_sp.AAC.1